MRLFRPFLALLLLAAPLFAAELKAPPSVSVPPLLLGPVSDAAHPLWRALDVRASAPAGQALALPPSAAPLEVLSARVLAAAAADPRAAAALAAGHPEPAAAARLTAAVGAVRSEPGSAEALSSLSAAAKADPAASALFDGAGSKPVLGLETLVAKGSKLKVRGQDGKLQKPQFLGQGEFGAVYVHPQEPGLIVKAVEHGFEVVLAGEHPSTTADDEEKVSRALAAADAGPRYLGRTVLGGREVSVRERVFGDTMQHLAWDRKFTAEDRELVLDLLRRMAKARLMTDDKRAPNIMLGTTALDPRRRAYLVDGGHILPVADEVTDEQLYEQLLHQSTILLRKFDPHVGEVEISKPFSAILDEAVRRSQPRSWVRVLKDIGWAIINARFAPK